MGPIEALKMALAKEVETKLLYEKLAVQHPVAKTIFLVLSGEEQKHAKLIEDKINELTN